jgi:3-dehydroquinate dehydratase/shikimate dehydrogenase
MSPYIHNAAFKFHNLNSVFVPFAVKNLDEFVKRFVRRETREIELNLKGFSVTIPHKQAIIKHLDFVDETAQKIGAVNTIKIVGGELHGYNTDAQGFIEPLKTAYGDLKDARVAIVGNGGAARACIYALRREGAKVTIYARDTEKAEALADEFDVSLAELRFQISNFNYFDIIVNATPLGTIGEFQNETPAIAEQIKKVHLVYDLIYNPFETRFLCEAKSVGVPTIGGLAMLIAQAMAQFKLWTTLDAPMKEMSRAALRRLQ